MPNFPSDPTCALVLFHLTSVERRTSRGGCWGARRARSNVDTRPRDDDDVLLVGGVIAPPASAGTSSWGSRVPLCSLSEG